MNSSAWRVLLFILAAASASCSGTQSVLNPQGPQAGHIANLWWFFLTVSAVVMIAVSVAVYLALARRGRTTLDAPPTDGEPRKFRNVAIATGLTAAILLLMLVYSVYVGSVTSAMPGPEQRPITVDVIGRQWWWEFRYVDAEAHRTFTTANELRIPVGRPVIIRASSRDVIHSFWVPNLHGKIDLVPGRTNTIWIQADRAGEFRGQCAEFCGIQHARMAFLVIAEPEPAFDAWVAAYLQPATSPMTEQARLGEQVFTEAQCSMCHTIRGTGAWGQVAPDLTRIGNRRTLAAATLPNTRGNLAGWIADPQHIKPGNHMPATALDGERLQALLDYLEGLK